LGVGRTSPNPVSVTGKGLVNNQSGGTVPGSGVFEVVAEGRGASRVGSGEGSGDAQPVTRTIMAIAAKRLTDQA
jgi:hypothetical protein